MNMEKLLVERNKDRAFAISAFMEILEHVLVYFSVDEFKLHGERNEIALCQFDWSLTG